jgi:hypothetical protein
MIIFNRVRENARKGFVKKCAFPCQLFFYLMKWNCLILKIVFSLPLSYRLCTLFNLVRKKYISCWNERWKHFSLGKWQILNKKLIKVETKEIFVNGIRLFLDNFPASEVIIRLFVNLNWKNFAHLWKVFLDMFVICMWEKKK